MRLLDREGDHLGIGRVAADERDVSAVQRRHDARPCAGVLRQHLIGQIRGRRMRHGVVRMHDLEVVIARYTRDRGGKRQEILWFAKQWIRRDRYRLEGETRRARAQPEWRFAADEMNVMSPVGQGVRQFGRHDATPAHRRITHHPDSHGVSLNRLDRCNGSRTTIPSANRTPARAPNCASRLSINCRNVGAVRRVGTPSSPVSTNWLR